MGRGRAAPYHTEPCGDGYDRGDGRSGWFGAVCDARGGRVASVRLAYTGVGGELLPFFGLRPARRTAGPQLAAVSVPPDSEVRATDDRNASVSIASRAGAGGDAPRAGLHHVHATFVV